MQMHGLPRGILSPPVAPSAEAITASEDPNRRWGPAPGTLILVFVFLAAFITYYFTNWKVLSFLWQIG
jgi:hypothetical protein